MIYIQNNIIMDFNFNEEASFNQNELKSTFDRVKWDDGKVDVKKMNKYYLEIMIDNIKLWTKEKRENKLDKEGIVLLNSISKELNELINKKWIERNGIEYRTWIKLTELEKVLSDWVFNGMIISKDEFMNWENYFTEYKSTFEDVTTEFEGYYQSILKDNKPVEKKENKISKVKKVEKYSNPFFDEMFEND